MVRKMAFGLPVGREAAAYLKVFGPSNAPMYYFPNTPDTRPIRAEARRVAESGGEAALRAEFDIAPDAPILLFVGRLIDAKRPLDAVNAFLRLERTSDATLVIAGDGDRMDDLRHMAAGDPRIVFTGWIRDPAKTAGLMSIAAALLLPSEHEPWGAVVNEAMAAGTPVISSDRVGAAIELIDSGRNGFLVPVGDVEALGVAMEQLLHSRQRAHRMGAAASRTAQEFGEEFAATNFVTGALRSIGLDPQAGKAESD
jgi:glycosyltransferase involved in cell wall biosynthesis